MRLLKYMIFPLVVVTILLTASCKTRPRKLRIEPNGEPVKASAAEQISLYLTISPRDLMVAKMPTSGAGIQISGGWGFSRGDACVLHNPRNLGQEINKSFLNWVQALIDVRNVLEFTQTLPSGERLYVIDSANYIQENLQEGNRRYLKVLYSVFTVNEAQFREMSYWVKDPKVNEEMFASRIRAIAREQERIFWFDITEPHTHNARIRGDGA